MMRNSLIASSRAVWYHAVPNTDFYREMIANSSLPTGKVFRKAMSNEKVFNQETEVLYDASTNSRIILIFDHFEEV